MENVTASRSYLIMSIMIGIAFVACDKSTNSSLGSLPKASFTTQPLSGNANKILVKSTSDDVFMWRWHFGNGAISKLETDTVTYIHKGDYDINLTVYGRGGVDSTSKTVQIASDYQGNNVLRNDGALAADNWTYLNISGGGKVNVDFHDNVATFTNSQYTYGAIYQPVQVTGGQKYLFSAHIKGSGLGSQSWFEIYLGSSQPMQDSDYTDNKFVSLNTYVPCGGSPFDGDLANIGCSGTGTGKGGIITFSQTGTIYLVVKPGSNGGTLGDDGVTLESISLQKL